MQNCSVRTRKSELLLSQIVGTGGGGDKGPERVKGTLGKTFWAKREGATTEHHITEG